MKERTDAYRYLADTDVMKTDLSNRTKNALYRNGYIKLADIKNLKESTLLELKGLGRQGVDEVLSLQSRIIGMSDNSEAAKNLRKERKLAELLEAYFENHDYKIELMGLSGRACAALQNRGINTVGELMKEIDDDGSLKINIGRTGKKEIVRTAVELRNSIREKIQSGEITEKECRTHSTEGLENEVLEFVGKAFKGVNLADVNREFKADGLEAFRKLLRKDKVIKEEDDLYYPVCPKASEVIEKIKNERYRTVITKKMAGCTLEEIGSEFNLTRERIRQILAKGLETFRDVLKNDYHLGVCEEEKYSYIFENYHISKEEWDKYFKGDETYGFLRMVYVPGKSSLAEAINDEKLNVYEKAKMVGYSEAQFIVEGRDTIPKNRYAIEDYLISHRCTKTTSYSEYIRIYKEFTEKHNLTEPDIIWKDNYEKFRCNQLAASPKTLWTNHSSFRYYDIESRDYKLLYNTLKLEEYKNVEISTKLLFRKYKALMKSYNIQNEYELHNLLRKTYDQKRTPDMSFGRQPTLKFGKADRNKMVMDVLERIAPCTQTELALEMEKTYGFNAVMVSWGTWFDFIKDKYKDGKYYL